MDRTGSSMVRDSKLKQIIQSISEFPTLPSIVARVMQILDNPYSSASDLTEIISHDQAMMFRILKMANSAYYGFPRSISTVTESIVLLGFSTVRNLILTTMMYNFDQLWESGVSGKIKTLYDQRREWRHSVATAIGARELLFQHRQESTENLGYLAGLMHDIGKTLFCYYFFEDYQKVLTIPAAGRDQMSEIEEKHMGAHHGQVGAWIVDHWNLPEDIVIPIACHHFPQQAGKDKELTLVLHQADMLAHAVLNSEKNAEPLKPEDVGLSEDVMKITAQKMETELNHIETFMVV